MAGFGYTRFMKNAAASRATRRMLAAATAGGGSSSRPGEASFPAESIQARLVELRREVPRSEWCKVPPDGSCNLNYYVYGAPRKQ